MGASVQNVLIGVASSAGSALLLWLISILRKLGKSALSTIDRLATHETAMAEVQKAVAEQGEAIVAMRHEVTYLSGCVNAAIGSIRGSGTQ